MNCPYCNNPSRVINSRKNAAQSPVWRRRKCVICQSIWTTHELIDLSTTHRVESSSGQLSAFSRDVLFSSIKDAIQHRKTALNDASALTDTVIRWVLSNNSPIIKTDSLSEACKKVLHNFDSIGAGVYEATHR